MPRLRDRLRPKDRWNERIAQSKEDKRAMLARIRGEEAAPQEPVYNWTDWTATATPTATRRTTWRNSWPAW